MASSSIVTKIREQFTVGMSLVGLLVNMGAPTSAAAQTHAPASVTPIERLST